MDAIEQHAAYLHESGRWREREHLRAAFGLQELLREELIARLMAQLPPELIEAQVQQMITRTTDPYTAVNALLAAASPLAAVEANK
jgi:putative protein kinase ArgK-like GTPase of G3E family